MCLLHLLQLRLWRCLCQYRLHLRRCSPSTLAFSIFITPTFQNSPFITFPFTFNFPLINKFWAFAFPLTNFPKFSSLRIKVTSAFFPVGASPLATSPVSFRSMCQAASSPAGFLSLKAKTAAPALMAVARSLGEEREEAMRSKALEDGKASRKWLGGWETGGMARTCRF